MDNLGDFYNESLNTFHQITKKPLSFLKFDESFCNNVKDNMKRIYDFSKNEEIKSVKSNVLPQLVVENFDFEQIWQQIELQNDSIITQYLKMTSTFIIGKSSLLLKNYDIDVKIPENCTEFEKNNNEDVSEDDEEENLDENLSDSNSEIPKIRDDHAKSVVDDEFFRLDEMEKFVQAEEKKMNDLDSGNDSDESKSDIEDMSVDLFEVDSEKIDDGRTAKYRDFFMTKNKESDKSVETSAEEDFRSTFEARQNRLIEKISQFEEEVIQERPWQLKGEITGERRPENSLLEEVVEFDLTTKPALVITEQTTMQLEDIIRQRIRDRVFDSVERKNKPTETALEFKKKIVLEQEKSKQSLAQIYEREFVKQQAALDPENRNKENKEPELHLEINGLMKSLFVKLDALSNFHFTPKPAMPDLKIVSNLPAISMEEVTPVATSDGTLLAPEEVKTKPRSDLLGKSERTITDKKRERRKKKQKQKMHAKKKETKLGKEYSKEKIQRTFDKVIKGKNVDKMDESYGDTSIKSSKAFFGQLQEQVRAQIKRKNSSASIKITDNNLNAKKLKL